MKTLKISTLPKGYCDPRELLLHASFQCLVDFIEKENAEIVDWNDNKELRKAWKEIQSLYNWWTKERPNRKDPLYDPKVKIPKLKTKYDKKTKLHRVLEHDHVKYAAFDIAARASFIWEAECDKEDMKNLIRLAKIREYLWV